MENIFLRHGLAADGLGQTLAEGLDGGEIDAAALGVDGVALHVVEIAVRPYLIIIIESVEAEEREEALALQGRFGQVGEVHARGVGEDFDVELELVLLHGGGTEGIDVAHHQVPVAHLRRAGRVLQRLHEEHFLGVLAVGGELADLVGLSAIGVFVGHGQHLVGLEGLLQRHIAQGGVERVFRGRELAGRLEFFVVYPTRQPGAVEHLRGGRNIARTGQFGVERGVERVGVVVGIFISCGSPLGVADVVKFSQVGEGHEVAGIGGGTGLVGHPDFHAVDGDARSDGRELAHVFVVVVAEEVGEKEVAVLVVGIGRELVARQLCPTLAAHLRGGGFLLGHHGAQLEFAKLHVGAHAEEGGGTADEGRLRGHAHVARLDELDDFVFLAFVAELQVLRVEVESGLGIVGKVHVYLIPHFSVEAQVYFLVEIKAEDLAVALAEAGVVGDAGVRTDLEFGRALGLHAHAARAEDFVHRSEVKLHVGEVETLLALGFKLLGIAVAVVGAHRTLHLDALVFFPRKGKGRFEVFVAQLRAPEVAACLFVILPARRDVFGVAQVNGSPLGRVGEREGHGPAHLGERVSRGFLHGSLPGRLLYPTRRLPHGQRTGSLHRSRCEQRE